MKARQAKLSRKTRETDIELALSLDGTGQHRIKTGLPFFDHMLELFSRHSLMDVTLKAKGDLAVDDHHTVEDIGLCLGTALDQALGDRKGIGRYGHAYVPMDDALSRVVVDLGGRPFLIYEVAHKARAIKHFEVQLVEEFLRAFCVQGRMNLHVAQLYGKEAHHAYEAIFKALARALRVAVAFDAREKGVPSSKGTL